jgi:hypothetical protein
VVALGCTPNVRNFALIDKKLCFDSFLRVFRVECVQVDEKFLAKHPRLKPARDVARRKASRCLLFDSVISGHIYLLSDGDLLREVRRTELVKRTLLSK